MSTWSSSSTHPGTCSSGGELTLVCVLCHICGHPDRIGPMYFCNGVDFHDALELHCTLCEEHFLWTDPLCSLFSDLFIRHTFCRHHNEAWIPTLRLLHQFPFLLTPQRVDKGAIKFVLSGANIMCPGLIHSHL